MLRPLKYICISALAVLALTASFAMACGDDQKTAATIEESLEITTATVVVTQFANLNAAQKPSVTKTAKATFRAGVSVSKAMIRALTTVMLTVAKTAANAVVQRV
jgi:hypothetical protein